MNFSAKAAPPSHMFLRRSKLLLATIVAWPALMLPMANAQTPAWPSKPIHLVVGVPAGGNTDTIARAFAKKLSESVGQPVIVDNKPGATATIGTAFVVRSPPDGYTFLVVGATGSGLSMNASLFPNLPYDTMRDLAPVSGLTRTPWLMVVNPSLPVKNLKEFIALAKSKPGEITVATGGSGGGSHLGTELMTTMAGIKVNPIHYKGNAPSLSDTIAGVTSMTLDTFPTALPHVKSGRVRAIAISGPTRSPLLPDVPTMSEAGLPGYEMTVVNGLLAPAGTPRAIVERMAAEVAKFAKDPEMRQHFAQSGSELLANQPSEFTSMIEKDIAKWAKIVKDGNIKLE